MPGGGIGCVEAGFDNGLWIVRLNCPQKLNALSSGVLGEISNAVDRVPDGARVLVLVGEGKVFSAGIDLSEVAAASSMEEAVRPFEALGATMKRLLGSRVPTAVILEGPAIGGGAELALAADFILAAPGGGLSWPEAFWGLVPPLLSSILERVPLQMFSWVAVGGELDAGRIEGLGLGMRVNSRSEGLEILRGISERWISLEAVLAALSRSRKAKLEALESILPELYGLVDMGLVERARMFLGRRKR